MNCEQARGKISLYIDGELPKDEKLEFENHIKECKECYEEYLSLLEVVKTINTIEQAPLPQDFRENLKAKLQESQAPDKGNKKFRFKGFSKWTAGAAILLVGVFLTAMVLGQYVPFFNMKSISPMDAVEQAQDERGSYGLNGSDQDISSAELVGSTEAEMDKQLTSEEEKQEAPRDNISGEKISQNMQEKIIYSANMTLQVTEYDKAFESIVQYVKDVDGFVERSSSYNPSEHLASDGNKRMKEGYIFIRVPSNHLEDAIEGFGELGKVINKEMSGENITAQYRDLEVELSNLEIQEERIVEIMKKADKIEDILEIERELNRIRTEINSRKAILKNWDQLVHYSSIEIALREEEVSTSNIQGSPFKDMGLKMQKGFIQSINIIVDKTAKLIIFMAKAIPFIIILIALVYIFKKYLWNKIKKK